MKRFCVQLVLAALAFSAGASEALPPVTSPPESFFQIVAERDREAARAFYKKYIDVKGMPVVAAGEVADLALQRTYEIVTHLLAGRPDVLGAMVSNRMYLIIIGKDQVYTDMPEYRNHPNPAYQNERVRGTGGRPTSFGEENLLSLPIDRYDDESIGVHEFCHTIDGTLRSIDLVRTVFNLKPEQDWRYTFLQKLPNVGPPPGKFKLDPYYMKFTWAREFTVVGRQASDDALLKANDTIRKMFAYRHDILKALINDGVKLVVLGRGEKLAELPELKGGRTSLDLLARTLYYTPETKLLAVGEENVTDVIRVFADALYHVTAKRPVDPNWENRGRAVQQYELRVKRLDVRFDERLKELFEQATVAGKWKGTAAVHDRVAYWTAGVLAYFDVPSYDAAPADAPHPINSRESLKGYDPELFALVHETMAYAGRVDWRFRP